jgi:hypothetical protein
VWAVVLVSHQSIQNKPCVEWICSVVACLLHLLKIFISILIDDFNFVYPSVVLLSNSYKNFMSTPAWNNGYKVIQLQDHAAAGRPQDLTRDSEVVCHPFLPHRFDSTN